jgi:hypothetical protein
MCCVDVGGRRMNWVGSDAINGIKIKTQGEKANSYKSAIYNVPLCVFLRCYDTKEKRKPTRIQI